MCFVTVEVYKKCSCVHPGKFQQCKRFAGTLIRCDNLDEKLNVMHERCIFHVLPEHFHRTDLDDFDAANAREDYIDHRLGNGLDVVDKTTINKWYLRFAKKVKKLTEL